MEIDDRRVLWTQSQIVVRMRREHRERESERQWNVRECKKLFWRGKPGVALSSAVTCGRASLPDLVLTGPILCSEGGDIEISDSLGCAEWLGINEIGIVIEARRKIRGTIPTRG